MERQEANTVRKECAVYTSILYLIDVGKEP
jgi:hypothetical protein